MPPVYPIRSTIYESAYCADYLRSFKFTNTSARVAEIVAKTTALLVEHTIDIPRVQVMPKGEVSYGYKSFTLNLEGMNLLTYHQSIGLFPYMGESAFFKGYFFF